MGVKMCLCECVMCCVIVSYIVCVCVCRQQHGSTFLFLLLASAAQTSRQGDCLIWLPPHSLDKKMHPIKREILNTFHKTTSLRRILQQIDPVPVPALSPINTHTQTHCCLYLNQQPHTFACSTSALICSCSCSRCCCCCCLCDFCGLACLPCLLPPCLGCCLGAGTCCC